MEESGELGPNWSSAIGGGLGNRGELEGERAVIVFELKLLDRLERMWLFVFEARYV